SLLQHEQHRHHHQGHVVVPSKPTTHLIIGHPTLALAILERTLDPESLPLHLHKALQGGLLRSVAQRVFDGLARAQFPRGHKMPETGLRFTAIPEPYASL